MSKREVKMLVFLFLIISQSGPQITQPPIRYIDFHPQTRAWSNSLMFFSIGDLETSITIFSTEYTRATGEKSGSSWFGALGNMNMDLSESSSLFLMLGFSEAVELKSGEKVDIAGEIIEKSATLTSFSQLTYFNYSFDFMTMNLLYSSIGLVAEIPLHWALCFDPFISTTIYTGMWGEMSFLGYEESISEWSFNFYPSYGFDLVFMPFRNARDWRINLSAVMSFIEGNEGSSTSFSITVTKVWGKYFEGTTVKFL